MLIAVATKTGSDIDQHFGHAERFLIYRVEGADAALVDEKKVERYCTYDPDNPLRTNLLTAITDALQGCRAVVCSQIGQSPQTMLEQQGIEAFVATGPIKPTLVELAKLL